MSVFSWSLKLRFKTTYSRIMTSQRRKSQKRKEQKTYRRHVVGSLSQ